jgi:hypothetical protein
MSPRKETMRKTLTSLILLAALTGGVCGTHAEDITPEELAFHSLQSQNVQDFADRFKLFTKTDLTNEVLKKMGFWASAAPVAVDMAEKNKTRPTIHDPRHCKGDRCLERWAYNVGENKLGLEKDGQLTKLVTTNISGKVEATQYCYGYLGIISCTSDVENGHKLKRFMWFGLKEEGKGLLGQLYWADKGDFIGP